MALALGTIPEVLQNLQHVIARANLHTGTGIAYHIKIYQNCAGEPWDQI
jgi:hypothetical protein